MEYLSDIQTKYMYKQISLASFRLITDNYGLVLVPVHRGCPALTPPQSGVLRDDVVQPVVLGLVLPQVDLLYEDLPAVATGVRPLARVQPLVYFLILFQ